MSSPVVAWQVIVRAVNNTAAISNVDVIDVLPVSGLEGSDFGGSGDFVNATISSTSGTARILYSATTAPSNATYDEFSDSTNAAYNGPSGSTVWCDAPTGGSVVYGAGTDADCPQLASDVTALRIQQLGDFGTDAEIVVDIRTDATGNVGGPAIGEVGDVMVNGVQLHATGLDVPLSSSDETYFRATDEPPNTGVISGRVWDDVDADGVWDYTDTNGNGQWDDELVDPDNDGVWTRLEPRVEPVIAGATVTITGTSPDGSPFEATTTTDANGYYQFNGLYNGVEYTLTFTRPAGMLPTVTGQDLVGEVYSITLTTVEDQFTDNVDSGFMIPADLDIAKTAVVTTADGGVVTTARPGDTITYTVTVTNVADRVFSTAFPATFVDSLTDVLDDGELVGTPTASADTLTVVGDQLVWSGPLDPGASVVLTYEVLVTGEGDQDASNVAYVTGFPIDPDTGLPTDPATGDPSTPPADCVAPDCAATLTPIETMGELAITKAVSDTAVQPGE